MYRVPHKILFLVAAPPTLLVEGRVREAAQLGNQTFVLVDIFSWKTPSITISRHNSTHVGQMMNYSSTITTARVSLPVFDQVVETDGFQCIINFTVKSEEEFGEYQLFVTNSEGTATQSLEIVPEGAFRKCIYRHFKL